MDVSFPLNAFLNPVTTTAIIVPFKSAPEFAKILNCYVLGQPIDLDVKSRMFALKKVLVSQEHHVLETVL